MKNIGKNCIKLNENPVWHFDLPLIMMNTGLREVSMVMYRRPRLKKSPHRGTFSLAPGTGK